MTLTRNYLAGDGISLGRFFGNIVNWIQHFAFPSFLCLARWDRFDPRTLLDTFTLTSCYPFTIVPIS